LIAQKRMLTSEANLNSLKTEYKVDSNGNPWYTKDVAHPFLAFGLPVGHHLQEIQAPFRGVRDPRSDWASERHMTPWRFPPIHSPADEAPDSENG
jgi:hypothetical protein